MTFYLCVRISGDYRGNPHNRWLVASRLGHVQPTACFCVTQTAPTPYIATFTLGDSKVDEPQEGYMAEKPAIFTIKCFYSFTDFFTLLSGAWVGRSQSQCLAEKSGRMTCPQPWLPPVDPLHGTCASSLTAHGTTAVSLPQFFAKGATACRT